MKIIFNYLRKVDYSQMILRKVKRKILYANGFAVNRVYTNYETAF
jgi:hypothetical protein